jgi:hypothetical protein
VPWAPIRLKELLDCAIGIARERQSDKSLKRAGAVMRDLGWKRGLSRIGGKPMKAYVLVDPAGPVVPDED